MKCSKGLAITSCAGCQQWLCLKHFNEHRDHLTQEMDSLGQQHDHLHQDLISDNDHQHVTITRINKWEEKSIQTIRKVAEQARHGVHEYLQVTKNRLKISLNDIAKELQISKDDNDYTELELNKWFEQLKSLRQHLENPSTITIMNDDQNDNNKSKGIALIQVNIDDTVNTRMFSFL